MRSSSEFVLQAEGFARAVLAWLFGSNAIGHNLLDAAIQKSITFSNLSGKTLRRITNRRLTCLCGFVSTVPSVGGVGQVDQRGIARRRRNSNGDTRIEAPVSRQASAPVSSCFSDNNCTVHRLQSASVYIRNWFIFEGINGHASRRSTRQQAIKLYGYTSKRFQSWSTATENDGR